MEIIRITSDNKIIHFENKIPDFRRICAGALLMCVIHSQLSTLLPHNTGP